MSNLPPNILPIATQQRWPSVENVWTLLDQSPGRCNEFAMMVCLWLVYVCVPIPFQLRSIMFHHHIIIIPSSIQNNFKITHENTLPALGWHTGWTDHRNPGNIHHILVDKVPWWDHDGNRDEIEVELRWTQDKLRTMFDTKPAKPNGHTLVAAYSPQHIPIISPAYYHEWQPPTLPHMASRFLTARPAHEQPVPNYIQTMPNSFKWFSNVIVWAHTHHGVQGNWQMNGCHRMATPDQLVLWVLLHTPTWQSVERTCFELACEVPSVFWASLQDPNSIKPKTKTIKNQSDIMMPKCKTYAKPCNHLAIWMQSEMILRCHWNLISVFWVWFSPKLACILSALFSQWIHPNTAIWLAPPHCQSEHCSWQGTAWALLLQDVDRFENLAGTPTTKWQPRDIEYSMNTHHVITMFYHVLI